MIPSLFSYLSLFSSAEKKSILTEIPYLDLISFPPFKTKVTLNSLVLAGFYFSGSSKTNIRFFIFLQVSRVENFDFFPGLNMQTWKGGGRGGVP